MSFLPLVLFSISLNGDLNAAPAGMPVAVPENAIYAIPAASGKFLQPVYPETRNSGRRFYRWSVAAVMAANAADAVTSWNAQEANPFVAGTGTQFGIGSLAIKSGFVATSLLIEHLALRHRPDWYKRIAWMNVVTAGALGQVAGHNLSVR